jgi:hypothetical protein
MSSSRLALAGLLALVLAAFVWLLVPSAPPASRPTIGTPHEVGAFREAAPAQDSRLTDAPLETSPATPLAEAIPQNPGFARRQDLERSGYESAGESAAAALQRLAGLAAPADRVSFLRGMFARLSESGPREALRALKQITNNADREVALRALVEAWQPQPQSFYEQGELAREFWPRSSLIISLADNATLAAEVARTLVGGSQLAPLLGEIARREASRDPAHALSLGDGLEPAAREEFLTRFAAGWAAADPSAAWNWALQQSDVPLRNAVQETILGRWATTDPQAAAEQVAQLSTIEARENSLRAIGLEWAEKDTRTALNWANALLDSHERDVALASIREAAPVGIGAVLGSSPEGYPIIQDLVPGGAASSLPQMSKGSLIASVRDASGKVVELQGKDLAAAVSLLRGAPGTPVTLEIIPPGGSAADRQLVVLTRQQLLFKR